MISPTSPIFLAFESYALAEIGQGKKHLSAKFIVEDLRNKTAVTDGGKTFKIDNKVTARLAEMFDQLHPEYKGYFKHRQGPFKVREWDRPLAPVKVEFDTNGQGRFA